jgi:RHS repeat-associated protein
MLALNHIGLYVHGTATGEYRILHVDASGATRLSKLQYCGFDKSGNNASCTQPAQFDWIDLPQDSAVNKLVPMAVSRVRDGAGLDASVSYVHESDAAFWSNSVFSETPFLSQGTTYVEDGLSASNYTDTPTWTVSAISRSSGVGTVNTTEYAYNNVAGRTSAVRELLPDGTYTYTGTFGNTAFYRKIKGKVTNRERWTGVYGTTGSKLLSKSYTHWKGQHFELVPGHHIEAVYACSSSSFKTDSQGGLGHGTQTLIVPSYDSASALLTSSTTTTVTGQLADNPPARLYSYDADGYPVMTEPDCSSSWVQPTQTEQLSLSDTNFTRKVTSSNYTNDQTNWLIGFLSSETTTVETIPFGSASTTVNVSRTQYPGSLRAESVIEMAGTSSELTTSTSFDAYGNPTSVTQVGANVSSRTQQLANYLDNRYPQTITNALGHPTNLTYDRRFGTVESMTDPNSLVTRLTRNNLGRVTQKTLPNGTLVTSTSSLCASCPTIEGVVPRFSTSVEVNHLSAAYQGAPDTVTYHDARGRVIRKQVQGFAGEAIKRDSAYDDLGRIYKESAPYTGTPAFSVYSYDLRNRTVRIDHADGSTTQKTYTDLTTGTELATTQTITRSGASKTQSRFEQYNLLGQLIQSIDGYNSVDAVTIDYRYDEIGGNHWTQVDNNSNTVVTTSFDLGANQRTITDPNTGTTTFVMDALGQVIRQTDANGAVIDFDYDLLGRITARTDDATGTAPITNAFSYDTSTNGIGLLASRSSPGFVEDTYYTAGAQVQRVETSINVNGYSDSFITSFTYDNYGRTASQTYPSGLTAHTDHNSYGYAYQLRDGNNKVLSRVDTADHFGNPTKTTLGNGLITTRSYDGVTGAITSINTDSGAIQSNSYAWWSNGTLYQRQKGGTQETFTYDLLNRVKTATSASSTARTLDFTYDKLGNLLSKTSNVSSDVDVTSYTYTGDTKPHRLNTAVIEGVTHTYGYDSVGNIVSDDVAGSAVSTVDQLGRTIEDRSIVYNAFGKPTQVRKGDAAAPTAEDNFHYGPNGLRFYKKTKPSNDQAVYLHGGVFEVVIPASGDITAVEKSYLGDVIHYRDVTLAGSSERYEYVHTDHLGSAQVITDEAGQPVSGYGLKEFDPFGGYRTADWSQDGVSPTGQLLGTSRGFTGHEHLDDTGLIHMNGRVFDPELGRFMSADPIVQAPHYSQSYNRYAYVFNSPLSFTDPSGYYGEGETIDAVCGHDCERATISMRFRKYYPWAPIDDTYQVTPREAHHLEYVRSAYRELALMRAGIAEIKNVRNASVIDWSRHYEGTNGGSPDEWMTKNRVEINHNDPTGEERWRNVGTYENREFIPVLDYAFKVPLPLPGDPKWNANKTFGWNIGQIAGNQLGDVDLKVTTEVYQRFVEFNAKRTIWDVNLRTGEIRGLGQSSLTVWEGTTDFRFYQDSTINGSRWFFER